MTTFGERFKDERILKGLTQEQLAKKFFLNKSSISRYEKNSQLPEMSTLEKFADFFDVSIDYLLGKSDIKKIEQNISNKIVDEEKDIEQAIEETMEELMGQQGLMLCGEILDDEDLILIRNAVRNGIEYAKSMKKMKK